MTEKYYLTTPLYYVNSRPHIGHSYTNIAADALARWQRLAGREVLFLTGTDEHGQKINKAAREAGMEPQAFTDKISLTFRELWKTLDVRYDDFIRTTEPRHKAAVAAVWRALEKKGRLYKAAYVGWYCTPDETFFSDGQVVREEGKTLCPDCKRPVDRIEEENYFLKMSDKRQWLIDVIRKAEKLIVLPETRRNEVLGFLENNELQDLCISRPKSRLAWGIPVPLSDAHVTYVWFDALINYIAACGYGVDEAKMKKWWPADVHLIGKDILRHHAVYWPILLEALGLEPPRMIFAHGWWVQGGQKMSKSLGNVTDPVEVVAHYGVDPYRYFLLSETSFGQDGTFSEDALVSRYNMDLANDLGNLLHRSLTMCEKYFEGVVPDAPGHDSAIVKSAGELIAEAHGLFGRMSAHMTTLAFSEALREIWAVVGKANKFIEVSAPWTLAKENKTDDLKAVILALAEVLRAVAQATWPFMPSKMEALWLQLGAKGSVEQLPQSHGLSTAGVKVQKGAPLFPRIDTGEEKKGDKKKAKESK